ncbi:hypothetical protein OIU77_026897 [Salix suchowensis]|uniref:Uncharacterized protein n=1 Tax=Salix suchowensis TaxID=1278906 RepID=A0ABQ9BQX0_9ROSI|nr:hypothetical protein OIU77_026897 [Salix suchowensis]
MYTLHAACLPEAGTYEAIEKICRGFIQEFDSKLVDCDVGIIDDNGRWKRPLFDHFIPIEVLSRVAATFLPRHDRSNMFQCPELHL